MSTKTRFEKEAKGNSEMVYSRVFPGPTLMNICKVVDGVLSIKYLHYKTIDILTLLTLDTISLDQKFECAINI